MLSPTTRGPREEGRWGARLAQAGGRSDHDFAGVPIGRGHLEGSPVPESGRFRRPHQSTGTLRLQASRAAVELPPQEGRKVWTALQTSSLEIRDADAHLLLDTIRTVQAASEIRLTAAEPPTN